MGERALIRKSALLVLRYPGTWAKRHGAGVARSAGVARAPVPSMQDQAETTRPPTATLPRLFAQALGVGLLFGSALLINQIPCWGLFVLAALIAWPLWVYGSEVALFDRRMRLEHLTRPDSGLRRWLWAGTLTRLLQVLIALVLALLLLALAARLPGEHWAVLALDMLLLSLLVEPVRRRLRRQIREQRLAIVTRRWPLLGLNLAFLTLALGALDFFVTGMPDTRALLWHQVAEDAFRAEGLTATCAPLGWMLGALAVAEGLTRHAAQVGIPQLPDLALRISAWGLILLHAGALAWLFTRLQLGIVALVDRRLGPRGPEGTFTRAFVYTILVLAIPFLYASTRLAQIDPAELAERARSALGGSDPCLPDPAAWEALLASLSDDLDRTRLQARELADRRIDSELDALFARIEPGVDAYLDWYFTLLGEYERLAALATGGFVDLMGKQLERHLFRDTGFAEQLETLDAAIRLDSSRALADAADRLGQETRTLAAKQPCALSGLDLGSFGAAALPDAILGDLNRDATRAATALGGGAAAGAAAAKLLAKQTGGAVAAKLAAKKGFQTAAALAGKVAAKKGGSILLSAAGAATLCSPGGPAAAICGILAGTAAWLAVDKALVEIDEARLRQEMRGEILETLNAQKPVLAAAIKSAQGAAIDAQAGAIQAGMDRVFVPARDGL